MESWRSKKTLILSRTDMMGLVSPAEYVACVGSGSERSLNHAEAIWSAASATPRYGRAAHSLAPTHS